MTQNFYSNQFLWIKNHRSVEQHMRRNRCHQDCSQTRRQNRATRRHGISSRACGGSKYQTVSRVCRKRSFINVDSKTNSVTRLRLLNDDFIHREVVSESSSFGPHGHFQQHPIVVVILSAFFSVMPNIKGFNHFVNFYNGQISELAQIDANERNHSTVQNMNRTQHCAVTAYRHQNVNLADISAGDNSRAK